MVNMMKELQRIHVASSHCQPSSYSSLTAAAVEFKAKEVTEKFPVRLVSFMSQTLVGFSPRCFQNFFTSSEILDTKNRQMLFYYSVWSSAFSDWSTVNSTIPCNNHVIIKIWWPFSKKNPIYCEIYCKSVKQGWIIYLVKKFHIIQQSKNPIFPHT